MKALKLTIVIFLLISSKIFSQVVDSIEFIPSQKQEEKKIKIKKKDQSNVEYNDNTASLHIRHLEGMKCMDMQYGWAKYGSFVNLGYGQLLTDKTMINFHLNYEFGKIGSAVYDYKNLKIGLCHTVYKAKNTLFLNLGYGGIVGFINSNSEDLGVKEQKFNAGIYAGGNAEIYLFNKFSILAIAEQQYNFMDKFGKMHFHLGGGIRVYIY